MTGTRAVDVPTDGSGAQALARPVGPWWRRVRVAALIAYAAALAVFVAIDGVPTGRPTLAVIIIAGLSLTTIGKGWRAFAQVLIDWLPFTLVLMAYDYTRGLADGLGLPLHMADVVTWERAICFGHVPTVVLQQHLYDPLHVHWYDAVFTLIYTSHFLATPILAAVLWLRDRRQWLRFISRVIVLSVVGLGTYVLFPEAPPWMASRHGFITEHVARLSARGWIWLHLGHVRTTLDHAQRDGANPVAAMPSLHVAFAALVALFIASRMRTRWRLLLVLYPLAMGFTLVYTGEHYVIDVIAGFAYAAVVHLGMNRFEQWRASRAAAVGSRPSVAVQARAISR